MAGDRINFGINFDVGSAIKELGLVESALKSISNIANGMGMEKYWKTQEQLVTELRKSYQDFLNVQSKDSASELIKTANALKAIAGIDITKSISGLGDITDTISKAAKLAPEIANSFSPETFRSTFDALDTLKKQGADVNDVISRLSTNSDAAVLNKRIEELGERLSDARNRASSLEQELSDAKSGAGITELERRIEGLNDDLEIAEDRLRRVRAEAESEFDNFLRGHNIQPDDWEFSSYYENIRDGSETAIEAISRFRVEYQHLFDQADQGNTALAVLDSFQAKIDRLIEETTSLSAAISDMQMNGVKTSADGASNSLQGLADAMMEINNSSSDSSASGVQQNITSLVEKLNDLAGVDVEKLQNVRGILLSIVNMNGLSVTKTPVNNISALLETVKTFGRDGSSIAIPDFSKLNNLSIDKEQLKTLSSYLPKIAAGNYAGLHELEGITFDNLKNLSLENSVASIKAISSLTRALNGSDLSSANAFLTGLDFSKIQNVGVDEKLGAFATALAQLSKVPFEPLKNILSLSFQNLNSINIKDNAAQSIESLAKSLTTLSGARDELQQIIDFVSGYKASGAAGGGGGGPIISPKLNDELDGAKRKLESISAIYDKTKEKSQQLVGYTKNYVAELDKYIQKSHDIYRVDYDEEGTPTETLVTRNILDSLVEKEKLTKKAEQADIKANITTQNLIRTVNSYAATLEKSSKAASQAGLEDDQRVVGLNKIIQDLRALSLMIESASPDELLDLREVLSGIQVAGDKAKASVDGIVNAEKEVGKNTAALREEETAFIKFDTAISNLIAKYKAYVSAAEEANLQDNESVKSLQGYISALENLQSSANTPDSAGVKEFNAELVKIDNNASKAAKSVQSITDAAMKDAANEAKTRADTIKAIARYEAIRKQIINDINKSSKAERGNSSQDYRSLVQYRDAVEQLYQEYTHGSKSLQDFKDGLENIANGAAGASNNIRQAGEMTLSFSDRMKKALGNLSTYFGISRMIMQVVRYTRDLIKTSIELDKEMGQLRIVTDETEAAYSQYADTISDTAKTISASMTDLISATTTFARLGYSLDESSVLAKYTAMLQQVGDIDASAAQNAVTAITKAFSDEVDISNIESVMDRLVTVGNGFPISVEQIAEGMNNASSALSAAGNSLNESIALLAAANVTVQNASKSSTAVRTITARLRNSKAELDELGEEVLTTAKYQELLNMLTDNGVKIVDEATGKYNSTYEIMRQLSEVWGDLSDGIRATLTTQLAGVRNVDVFNSILTNFKETAVGAMDAMANSAGTLSNAYDEYLDTAAAHINSLKAAWQELAQSAIDSGVVNSIIDAGRSIVEILNTVASSPVFKTISSIVEALFKLIGALAKVANQTGLINTLLNSFAIFATANGIFGGLDKIGDRLLKLSDTANRGKDAMLGLAESSYAAGNMIKNIAIPAAVAVAAISALYNGLKYISEWNVRIAENAGRAAEEYRKQAEQLAGDVEDVNKELETNSKRLEELYEKLNSGAITRAELAEINTLELTNDQLETKIALMKEEQQIAQENADLEKERQFQAQNRDKLYRDTSGGYAYTDYQMYLKNGLQEEAEKLLPQIEQGNAAQTLHSYGEELQRNVDRYEQLTGYQAKNLKLTEDQKKELKDTTNFIRDEYLRLDGLSESLFSDTSAFSAEIKGYLDILSGSATSIAKEISNALDGPSSSDTGYRKSLSDLSETIEKLKDGYDLVDKAAKDMVKNDSVSYDTLKALISQYENYTEFLYESNGQLKIRVDLLRQEADATYDSDVASINKEIHAYNAQREQIAKMREEINKQGNGASWAQALIDGYDAELAAIDAAIEADRKQLQLFEAIHNTVADSVFDTKSTESTKKEEEAVVSLSDAVSNLKDGYSLLAKAQEEVKNDGKLSVDTIESIIKATEGQVGLLDIENGEIRVNEQAWKDYYKTKYDAAIKDLQLQKSVLDGEREVMLLRSGSAGADQRVAEIDKETAAIDQQISLYEVWLDAFTKSLNGEEKAASDLSSILSDVSKSFDLLAKAQEEMSESGALSYETIENIASSYPEYLQFLNAENGLVKVNTEALNDYIDSQNRLKIGQITEEIVDLRKKLSEYDEGSKEWNETQSQIDSLEHLREIYQASIGTLRESFSESSKQIKELSEVLDDASDRYGILVDAQKEMNDAGKLTYDTISNIVSKYPEYIQFLSTEDGMIRLNTEALKEYIDAQNSLEIEKLNDEIESSQKRLDELERGSREWIDEKNNLRGLMTRRSLMEAMFDQLGEEEKEVKNFADRLKELDSAFAGASSANDLLESAQREMAEAGSLSADTVRDLLSLSEDYVQFLVTEGDQIKLNTDAVREYIDAQNSSELKKIDDRIAELSANDENDPEIELLKRLRDAYELLFKTLENGAGSVKTLTEYNEELQKSLSDTKNVYDLIKTAQSEMDETGRLSSDTVSKIISLSDDYVKFLVVEGDQIKLNTGALEEYVDAQNAIKLDELESSVESAYQTMMSLEKGTQEWVSAKDTYKGLLHEFNLYKAGLKSVKDEQEYVDDSMERLSDALEKAANQYDILANAEKEMSEAGHLSYDTVTSIISKYPEYIKFLTTENGLVKLNTEALKDYIDAQNQLEIAKLDQEIEDARKKMDELEFGSREWLEAKNNLRGLMGRRSLMETMFGSLGENEKEIKEISEYLKELKSSLSDVTSTYDALEEAQREMSDNGGLSTETVEKLLSISDEYIQFLTVEHGMIKLNADALREYAEAQYASKITETTDRLVELRRQLADPSTSNAAAVEIEKQISLLESEITVYQTLFDTIDGGFSTVTDTTTYINKMRDSLQDLASVEEIVANGFVVAADKVKGMADVFPELFANAEAFADGSMKLDEDVTNAFLENRRLETNASIEAKITELEAELETVTAKKAFVDAELQLLTDLAQGKADIDKSEVEYRLSNAETLLNYLIDAGEDEASAYAIAAQSIADNSFDLDSAIATAAADIDYNYREAFASAADNSAANATAMNSNIATTAAQAHQAALAVAGMIAGRIQGSEGTITAGARGTKKIASVKGATKVDAPSNNAARAMNAVRSSAANTRITLVVGDFNGSSYTKTSEIKSLADLIIDRTNESNALELLKGQLEGQIALLRSLQKSDLSQFKDKAKTGSSSAGSGGSPSTSGSTGVGGGKGENPFEAMYREHQHLLAMEQESVSDYFAWLDKASKDAFNQGWITLDDLRKYEEEVYKGLKEIISDAESAMKDLVNFRVKMLEQERKDEKVALETQLDVIKAFYDDQKKQLKEQREEEEYEKEKAEKQREITDIEAELAMLGYDNSAKAQKRRVELQQQLAEAQAAYAEFEKDRAYQLAEDALDEAYEKQAGEIQAQIDAIDAILNDPNALFNQALEDIKNDTGSLYQEMVEFAKANGEGESTVQRLWENAFIATQDLQKVTSDNVQTISELLKDLPSDIANLIMGFVLQNSTGHSYTSTENTASNSAGSSTPGSSSASGGKSSSTIPVGTAVKATGKAYSTVKGTGNAVDVTGKQLYVAQVWDNAANPYWQGDYTYAVAYSKNGAIIGWVRKDQLSGYASGTPYATAGMHRVDEKGQEALFVSSNGDHYRLLSDGDKVFNAKATDFLYRFANGDKDIFRDLFSSVFSKSALNNIANRQSIGDVRMGDIIINGNADKATVSEIRRAQRESVDNLLQQFGRLQRAAY